jgi:hypothetical protein
MSINSTNILEFYYDYVLNSIFSLPQSQSLNACKRVGVRSHIPYFLGAWGLSTISLGKCVSQESKPRRGNLYGKLQQF